MAMNQVLSAEREFRYIIMWFNEFSEMQREDFIPIACDYLTKNGEGSNAGHVYMNGLVNGFVSNATVTDKPMSLFQCRMKLFREWSSKWPVDFQGKLKEKITEMDPKIGELIMNEIKRHNNGDNHNLNDNEDHNSDYSGATSISEVNHVQESDAVQLVADSATRVDASDNKEATIDDEQHQANNGIIDMLTNESSVDDYDEEQNDNHGSQHVDSNITVVRAATIELVDQVIHDATAEVHEREQQQQQANTSVTSNNNTNSATVELPLVA